MACYFSDSFDCDMSCVGCDSIVVFLPTLALTVTVLSNGGGSGALISSSAVFSVSSVLCVCSHPVWVFVSWDDLDGQTTLDSVDLTSGRDCSNVRDFAARLRQDLYRFVRGWGFSESIARGLILRHRI